MSGDLGLEQRYRRVLRLLPGYYRDNWEEDMVAAFLDSWMTGDPEVDGCVLEFCRPGWSEVASVVGLAVRLRLGGAGAPRRYFAWGQAVRRAVLVVMLVHAALAVDEFVRLAWTHHAFSWLPAASANVPVTLWGGAWISILYAAAGAWIVTFVLLTLGYYRAARLIAVLAAAPGIVAVVRAQLAGAAPILGSWASWILLSIIPVMAMAAFHSGAPAPARRAWLLALPAFYLLVYVPLLTVQATGNFGWLPDSAGLCCILVSLACLAHAPWAWSRRSAGSDVWSLTLILLAAVAGVFRIFSLTDYVHDRHLIYVGLVELLILVITVALVAPSAARAQAATPASPASPAKPRPA